jgi:predicted metal-binding membrane protein
MNLRLSDGKLIALRTLVAAGFIGSVLFTLLLCAIPQLHESVHHASSTANHECAVTLLTSGNYQHTVSDTIALALPRPPTAFAHVSIRLQLFSAPLEFSPLEHAPPAIS